MCPTKGRIVYVHSHTISAVKIELRTASTFGCGLVDIHLVFDVFAWLDVHIHSAAHLPPAVSVAKSGARSKSSGGADSCNSQLIMSPYIDQRIKASSARGPTWSSLGVRVATGELLDMRRSPWVGRPGGSSRVGRPRCGSVARGGSSNVVRASVFL